MDHTVANFNGFLVMLISAAEIPSSIFTYIEKDSLAKWFYFCFRILSYINNLDPAKHQKLYKSIEEIITRTIPLWNITLTPQRSPEVFYTRLELRRIIYDGPEAVKPDVGSFMPPLIPGEPIPKQYDHDPTVFQRKHLSGAFEFSDPKTYYTTPPWHFPGFFKLPMDWNVDLQKDYGKQGLQVIVKLANIHLTPEKPEYGGGTWHIEGQMVCRFFQRRQWS